MANQHRFIKAADLDGHWTWTSAVEALRAGHARPRATIADTLVRGGDNQLLTRSAFVPGIGFGFKAASIFPGNASLPSVHSVCTLFDEKTGAPRAFIDGDLVTRVKTAADSVLGARLIARPDSQVLTIVGAGKVARALIEAYSELFPQLAQIFVWNRTYSNAEKLVRDVGAVGPQIDAVRDLDVALAQSDMVSSATFAATSLVCGDKIRPGTHVDLIGAYSPNMREADDALISKSKIFVDCRETALHDTGELGIPLANGLIEESDIAGDLYDLTAGAPPQRSDAEITLFKNGGGAHLDIMIANYLASLRPG